MITGKGLQKQLPKAKPAKTPCHPEVPQRQKEKPLLSKARFYSNEQEHEEEPAVSGCCTQRISNTGTRGKTERWKDKVLLKAKKHTAPASTTSPVSGPKALVLKLKSFSACF